MKNTLELVVNKREPKQVKEFKEFIKNSNTPGRIEELKELGWRVEYHVDGEIYK